MDHIKTITEEDRELINEMLETLAHALYAVGIFDLSISVDKQEINWDVQESGLINERALESVYDSITELSIELEKTINP